MSNQEQLHNRPHDVQLPNGYDSLFADSSERTTRYVSEPVKDAEPAKGRVLKANTEDSEALALVRSVNEVTKEAHDALAEAKENGEDYSLRDASREEVITMMHAVTGTFGEEVAESTGTDHKKLEIARVQLNDALAEKMERPGGIGQEVVDPATFVLTAVALARMRKEASDMAERTLASDALGSLREAGDLERIKHQEEIGHHTGEIAVAAIMGYEPATV